MATLAQQDLSVRATALQQEIDRLEKQLGPGIDADKVVKRHIELLHDYNESKDACQVILGKLAVLKQSTVRQLHTDYGLMSDD
ncbi:DNA repair protein [Auriculariales sp. MPI-PUGE-AT-0066]|nr:DNA repair protein [Auriculariales sp. MPI-PUGE-AT-0066]